MVSFGNSWDERLAEEFEKPYYRTLRAFLKEEYEKGPVYPPMGDIFNALRYTDYDAVKVVILGQDPYHEPGQAQGLAFSVAEGVDLPPSLKNIFQEYMSDLKYPMPSSGCLIPWTKEGVLLLNTCLTVRAHEAGSHKGRGWETFTDRVISLLNEREAPMVFLLWGSPARAKRQLITNPKHLVLEAPHPSPLSAHRGFFGGRYFSLANAYLTEPVDWRLP